MEKTVSIGNGRKILFLQDNHDAQFHVTKIAHDKIVELEWEIISQSPLTNNFSLVSEFG